MNEKTIKKIKPKSKWGEETQKEDANGNGVEDRIITLPINTFASDIAQWFGLDSEVVPLDDATGAVTSPWYNPNVKEYIAFTQKLNEAVLIDTNNQASQKNTENKVSGVANCSGETWLEPVINLPEGAAPAEYVPILLPAVEGQEPLVRIQRGEQNNDSQKYVINSKSENIAGVFHMIDYLCTDEFNELRQWGIEGVTFEIKDDKRAFQRIKSITPYTYVKEHRPS